MRRLNRCLVIVIVLLMAHALAWGQGPTTPILDDFTHSNNPLSNHANWGGAFDAATTGLRSSSGNFVDTSGTPACSSSMYTASTFGPDMEAYATHGAAAGSDNRLFVRTQSPFSAAVDGYVADHSCTGSLIIIYRIDNGALTPLGSNIAQSCTVADRWLLRIEGDTLTLEYDAGGGWSVLATRTDATYSGTGNIGIGACTSSEETNFGGGTLGGAAGRRRQGPIRFQ